MKTLKQIDQKARNEEWLNELVEEWMKERTDDWMDLWMMNEWAYYKKNVCALTVSASLLLSVYTALLEWRFSL